MRNPRRTPPQSLHGRGQTAHKLIIVVGIQDVVFTIVLGLRHQIDALEALGEIVPRALAFGSAAIGEAAPIEIDIGKVATIAPAPPVHPGLPAPARSPRLPAQHAIRRPAPRPPPLPTPRPPPFPPDGELCGKP